MHALKVDLAPRVVASNTELPAARMGAYVIDLQQPRTRIRRTQDVVHRDLDAALATAARLNPGFLISGWRPAAGRQ